MHTLFKIKIFFLNLYFKLCLWLYMHSQCLRDIGWVDNKTHFYDNINKECEENES